MVRLKLLQTQDVNLKCQILWDYYCDSKNKEFEPQWTHQAFEIVKKNIDSQILDQKEQYFLKKIIQSYELEDGSEVSDFPNKPPNRIIHDGWKAGSATWIFMGRKLCDAVEKGDWVIIHRTLPQDLYSKINSDFAPPTLWLAYHKRNQMMIAENKNVVGPAIYSNQIIYEIDNMEHQ